jgi:hypothetical protein
MCAVAHPSAGRSGIAFLVVAAAAIVLLAGVQCRELRECTRQAAVCSNAHTVQLAAEVFAVQHGGVYAHDPLDLAALFPAGEALRNPYTGGPVVFDGSAGDLTYSCDADSGGYRIVGYGRGDDAAAQPLLALARRRASDARR